MKVDQIVKDAGLIFVATALTSIFSLLYQLYMVRVLDPVDFGVLNSLLPLMLFIAAPTGTLQTVATKFIAGFKAQGEWARIHTFLKVFFKKVTLISLAIFAVFALFSKSFAKFFKIDDPSLIIMVGLMMMGSTLLPFAMGILQGLQKFKSLGTAAVLSSALKLGFAILFVTLGLRVWGAFAGIVVSSFITLLLCFFPLRPYIMFKTDPGADPNAGRLDISSVYKFCLPVFLGLPSFTVLTNVDMILVKRFFSPTDAGYYAIAQMVGKIILFLPTAVTMVMFPKVTECHVRNEGTKRILKKCLLSVGGICVLAGIVCSVFPNVVLKILCGKVYPECIPLVIPFVFSMTFFSLNNVFLYYYLSTHRDRAVYLFLIFSFVQVIGIVLFHGSLLQVLYVLSAVSFFLFVTNQLVFAAEKSVLYP
ncbi:MAG: oligosaccharide flippase family protein [Candidatus Omnitrophica bacterium]|nr:oligosaccharide flippase family protein [Candidatus Omnitrophota bacterium]